MSSSVAEIEEGLLGLAAPLARIIVSGLFWIGSNGMSDL
jgi:hypothetical protein